MLNNVLLIFELIPLTLCDYFYDRKIIHFRAVDEPTKTNFAVRE